ncbi:MAG: hypothetical protein KF886_21395 [Candidatus Hydrogenedentes bacterium]|nr:hypothetical protein [Candidatus Hydrogenedentota bacterium]
MGEKTSTSSPTRPFARFLVILSAILLAHITHAENASAYTIEPIPTPPGVAFEASALETLPDGRIAAATRMGEVWLIGGLYENDPAKITFKKIAEALHEPLGLLHRDGGLYVTQRPELTHLRDTDGDDVIDEYNTVTSDWGITGNYHEYAYGPVPDPDGGLWVTLNIGMGKANYPEQDAWRGWGLKVYPDGRLEPQCAGMRSPAGVGENLEGDVFFTDQQGDWIPAGSLHQLRAGAFYGHVSSLKHCDRPGAPFARPEKIPSGIPLPQAKAEFPMLSLPAVWFPYKKVGMSTTDILAVENDDQIGPFRGQLLVGDFTTAAISRVFLERVNGEYQGACFNFLDGFQSAVLRMTWARDGSLIVGESNRGWNSVGTASFGIDRVTWNRQTPFEIQEMRLEHDGFTLRFTKPVNAETASDPAAYTMSSYTLMYHKNYGSPEVDTQPHAIRRVTVSEDGLEVRLETDIRQYHIHEIHAEGVRSAEGAPLVHADAYYTANQLREP